MNVYNLTSVLLHSPIQNNHQYDGEGEDASYLLADKAEVRMPRKYAVVMLNDDFTPMDFVVDILRLLFGMNEEQATQIMLAIHTQGKAVCGVYTRDIAETKATQVNEHAEEHQHPLRCEITPLEDA